MSQTLRVLNNGDHVGLIWFPQNGQKVASCRGFSLERRLTPVGSQTPQTSYLANHVGFSPGQTPPAAGEEWKWPIQRYMWWDYAVDVGDVVSYRVIPVVGPDQSHLQLDVANGEPWSAPQTITGQDSRSIEAYFNRGIVASQWVARELDAEAASQGPRAALMAAIGAPGNALRNALGGLLKQKLLGLLNAAASGTGRIYAALYELNDPEILTALKLLGPRCFLILGNGAFKPPSNDENAGNRTDLRENSSINLFDRLVTGAHFAHNKFIVFCDSAGTAQTVWTGSTNFTVTGLCTQANNGILISDSGVADAYLQAWQRLHAAGNDFPPTLIKTNSVQRSLQVADAAAADRVSVWFAPTDAGEDMEQARQLINQAQQGILFLFFNPGGFQDEPANWTLLQSILNRQAPAPNPYFDANLYIRGVVNQEIPGLTSAAAAPATPGAASPQPQVSLAELDPTQPVHPVALFTGAQQAPARLDKDVLVPANVKAKYSDWEAELKGASNVMIHSKVVVVDPFGEHPVLMTGSHNMGMKASRSNDDNLVIIEGNPALAQAYALNAIAIFQEYRWRQYVNDNASSPDKAWHGLEDNDTWQDGHLQSDRQEIAFWLTGAP